MANMFVAIQQSGPSSAELRAQTREQIRQQIEAARQQIEAARQQGLSSAEQERLAREAIRAAERALAQTSTSPGVTLAPPWSPTIPPQAVDIATSFFVMIAVIVVGLPLARAFARRLDRKPIRAVADPAMTAQLDRIEQAVDAMAIEIERISEAQRYMAKLHAERAEPELPPRGVAE